MNKYNITRMCTSISINENDGILNLIHFKTVYKTRKEML